MASHTHTPEYSKKRRNDIKKLLDSFKILGCEACPETDPIVLEFHHLNPKDKKFTMNFAIKAKYSLTMVMDEVVKCAVLCANCHRRIHAKSCRKSTKSGT